MNEALEQTKNMAAWEMVSDGSQNLWMSIALLIDDEELVRAATSAMLIELGYAVVEAASAEAALDLVRGGLVPDLLVTDQLMPGMTGTQFAQMMRVQQPQLPVLIVSGYADADSLSEDFHHLAKPFRHADLEAALAAMTATS